MNRAYKSICEFLTMGKKAKEWSGRPWFNSRSRHNKDFKNAPLLNTQQCKVRIKGKVDQSRERSSAHSYILV